MKNLFCRGALIPASRVERPPFLQIFFYWRLRDMINVDLALSPDTAPLLKRLKGTGLKEHVVTALAGYLPRRQAHDIAALNGGGRLANLLDASLERFGQW